VAGPEIARSGDASFREFAAAQWSPLGRTAYLLVGDRGHAEDLVQTVLAKMWAVWPRVADQAPEAYARRVLTNAATSWWRRRWHGERATETLPDVPADRDLAGSVAERLALGEALRQLPARQRAAVVLRFAEDLSELDTAAVMGCSVGNVKALTSRGLAALRAAGVLTATRDGLTNGATR
jgi:RNA polymerase sigma-70 factor (ECF subfamily)